MEPYKVRAIYNLAMRFLQGLDQWEKIANNFSFVGLKETKKLWGLLSEKCPLCQKKTQFFSILCKRRDDGGQPIGKTIYLPMYLELGIFLPGTSFKVETTLGLGICPHGHEIVRLGVISLGGDGPSGNLVFAFRKGVFETIKKP
jgi:hypothetical protein